MSVDTYIVAVDKAVACNELLCCHLLVGKAVVAQIAVSEVMIPFRTVGMSASVADGYYNEAHLRQTVDTVHSAINSSKMISFLYFRYNSKKAKEYHKDGALYRVSPLSLVWNDENYYLIGYDEDAQCVKNFRVDKMEKVSEISVPRSAKALEAAPNPGVYTRKVFGMWGGSEELVTLECADSLAGVMLDRFGKNVHFESVDGGFRIRERVGISPNFFAWVAGFGKDVRIIAPKSARDAFLSYVTDALRSYGEVD